MEFEHLNNVSNDEFEDSIGLRDLLESYSRFLKWFIVSVILFIGLAFVKLRYEVPKYKVNAAILIKEKDQGSSISDLSGFEDLGLFGNGGNSLENEIQILKSRRLLTKVVIELKLNTGFLIEDSPYFKEKYPDFPINLNILSDSTIVTKIGTNFEILIHSYDNFEFFDFEGESIGILEFDKVFEANLGSEGRANIQKLKIERNIVFDRDLIGKKIRVIIKPVNLVVINLMNRLVIEPVNEKLSNVLLLSIEETVRQKGKAVINNLIEQYNADGISDKNEIAQTTTDFLDLRIGLISTELEAIEGTAEQFKSRNRMVDVKVGGDIFLQSSSTNEAELVKANTQRELVNYMLEKIRNSSDYDLLPGNIGLLEPSIIIMVEEFNGLILKRNRILKSSSLKNPIMIEIDSQLDVLKSSLIAGLSNLNSTFTIQIDALSVQSGKINQRIASVPKNEREYKDIVRQQETKNALYLFLLQKREESILSNAVGVNKAKIIDSAYSDGSKVSPKPVIAYVIAIFLGLFFPFGFLYVKNLLDVKVHSEKDLSRIGVPYLGDVPINGSRKNNMIAEGDQSSIAEAFRYIRTNIGFMLDSKSKGKTVFVTSTLSHEGKSFVSINMAISLALSGKKTLLIGLDLRAPRITQYMDLEDILGVTNFIKNEDLSIDDITEKNTMSGNLHVINSGDIPPNPVELLMSKRVEEIFNKAKNDYDFIIVDTAPVGMVTDTIQIGHNADLTIYVVKANYLDKRRLMIPEKLHKEGKLKNMAMLINGADQNKGAYGYGYGYGEKKKQSWFRSIFS